MKVLVIAAHPDDEVLGMGGTIKKYTRAGHTVKIVIMATGIFARRSKNYLNSTVYSVDKVLEKKMEKQVLMLQKDAKKAAKIMGAKDVEFMNFPDNEMDLVSNLEITKKIEKIIKNFNPNIVFTHSQNDVNIDHRILYNTTLTATRPVKKQKINAVYSFEIPSSTEWFFSSNFTPNVFVDISKELSIKKKALSIYKTEIRSYPHPRSLRAINIIAERWGIVSGFNAAEAFCLVRQLKNVV